MTNLIDILISAAWTGSGSVGAAGRDLRQFGDNAAKSSVEMAVAREKASALKFVLGELGKEVVHGNMSVEEATKVYKEAAESLGLMAEEAPKASVGFGGLALKATAVAATLTAAAIAGKKFYSFIRQGAELELVVARFDRLAISIGTTGDALRRDLSVSVQGLVSDMDAVALATDLMALGLVNSHDEAVRLSSIAVQLDFNLTQLEQTLTQQSTSGFDALGISVDGFEEKVRKLEQAGHDADEAFELAFVRQAEEQIERVGSRAETTAGQLDVLSTAWEDTANEMKLALLVGLIPFIESASEGILAVYALRKGVRDAERAVGDLAAQKAAVKDFSEALATLRGDKDKPFMGPQEHKALADFAARLAATGRTVAEQQEILRSFGFGFEESLFGLQIVLKGYKTDWDSVTESIAQSRLEAQASYGDWRRHRDFVIEAADSTEALTNEMEELAEKVQDIEFRKLLDDAGLTTDEFTLLAYGVGGAENAIKFLENRVTTATKKNEDYSQSVGGMIDNLLEFAQNATEIMEPILAERADIFIDFQGDLTTISTREGERREQVEGQYEERRTGIVDSHGLRRTQSEEDFQRRRARSEAKLAGDIAGTQEDSYERQAEIRENANERLADLERDHADRMNDIIRDADAELTAAAGKLNAAAVTAIQQQRERALEDEEQAYARSRDGIQRTLDDQLAAEQAAAVARISEMREYHAERRLLDEEDYKIRLDRADASNRAQLQVLDNKNTQALTDIYNNAKMAEYQRGLAYEDERDQLSGYWGDRQKLEAKEMALTLKAEEKWWQKREMMAGGLIDMPTSTYSGAAGMLPAFRPSGGVNVGDVHITVNEAETAEKTANEVWKKWRDMLEHYS